MYFSCISQSDETTLTFQVVEEVFFPLGAMIPVMLASARAVLVMRKRIKIGY